MGYTLLRRPNVPIWKTMADRDEITATERDLEAQRGRAASSNEFGEEKIWGGGSASMSEAGEAQLTPGSTEDAQGDSTVWERV